MRGDVGAIVAAGERDGVYGRQDRVGEAEHLALHARVLSTWDCVRGVCGLS